MATTRWKNSAIGTAGEPLAEALADDIDNWLYIYGGKAHPEELAALAQEVVRVLCEEKGLYVNTIIKRK